MTIQPLPPARLYVVLAREARVGVILRRGPTDWVQMIHWDTRKDTFTLGQWFHGKVYPEKSDISPDGSLIIYFAGKFGKQSDPMKRAWTAISKPPYFTALRIWFQDSTYFGGGLFENNQQAWHHGSTGQLYLGEIISGKSLNQQKRPDDALFLMRLKLGGWERISVGESVKTEYGFMNPPPQTWQKTVDHHTLVMEISDDYRWHSQYNYTLVNGFKIALHDVEWTDFDQRGRIIVAKEGKIFHVMVTKKGHVAQTELADFNANQPETFPAPEWATKW